MAPPVSLLTPSFESVARPLGREVNLFFQFLSNFATEITLGSPQKSCLVFLIELLVISGN